MTIRAALEREQAKGSRLPETQSMQAGPPIPNDGLELPLSSHG
jgi:hypothetical protein